MLGRLFQLKPDLLGWERHLNNIQRFKRRLTGGIIFAKARQVGI